MEEIISRLPKLEISYGDILKVEEYAKRKFALMKERDDSLDEKEYLPILFETEFVDFLMRREINRRGEAVCAQSA